MFLEISQNSEENTCARVSFLIKLQALSCSFIKKEALAQVVFSSEFCKLSKNTLFTEHLRWLFWKHWKSIWVLIPESIDMRVSKLFSWLIVRLVLFIFRCCYCLICCLILSWMVICHSKTWEINRHIKTVVFVVTTARNVKSIVTL